MSPNTAIQGLNKFHSFHGNNSYLISFEGIEGSGKTSQIEGLKKYAESLGYTVHNFREPGGTVLGEKLRSAILESDCPIAEISEAYIFAAARAQLLSKEILPKLNSPQNIVILDRYIDSSLAYQGVARGLGIQKVLDIHQYEPLTTLPSLTFYLKIDYETSVSRQEKRGNQKDYFESETQNFYNSLIEGYDKAADIFPKRISIIDGKQSIEAISTQVLNEFKKLIGQ